MLRSEYMIINRKKVHHLYSAANRICCFVGAVRHRQGRRSAYAAAQTGVMFLPRTNFVFIRSETKTRWD